MLKTIAKVYFHHNSVNVERISSVKLRNVPQNGKITVYYYIVGTIAFEIASENIIYDFFVEVG